MRSLPQPPTTTASLDAELAALQIIRTETVLSRLPIHNLSKKGKVDIQIIKRNERGEVDLRWEISHSDRYGQARQLAYKLDTLIINKRIDELDRPLPKIIRMGSLRDIARELGLGGDTNNVRKAFRQNAFIGITAKLTYKALDGREKYLDLSFSRYSVVFTGETLPDGTKADAVYLVLNDPFRDVLNNAQTRPLDYDYLKQLSPTAQRFYEIVSYKIYAALKFQLTRAKMPYSEYCMYSAQQRYFDYEHVKKQMYKVHRPHLQFRYIQKVSFVAATDSDGKPDWIMSYVPGPKARSEFRAFTGKRSKSKGTLDQDAVLPLETSNVSAPDDAQDLVQYFHNRFDHSDTEPVTAKDLALAKLWITQHGIAQARFIVDYSVEEAHSTKYNPNRLSGIQQYAAAAIKKFHAREKHRQEEERQQREAKLQDAYRLFRNTKIQDMESTLSAHELEDLKAAIREKLLANNPNPAGLNLGVQMHLDSELADRAGVPQYEEWRAQQNGR